MDNLTELYNILEQSTFSCGVRTIKPYLIFLKPVIEKILANANNYTIYVSTWTSNMAIYQSIWPSNPRLQYVDDTFIPTNVPVNINSVYIYHKKQFPTTNEQLALIEYVKNHPTMKYIYIGMVGAMLPIVKITLFHHYLHFEVSKRRWGRIRCGIGISYKLTRQFCSKYYAQEAKKKKADKVTMYDYLIYHNISMNITSIYRFNKTIYQKKTKKPKPVAETAANANITTKIVTKYVYTGTRTDQNNLVMPNGAKENYNDLVLKYKDLIEV